MNIGTLLFDLDDNLKRSFRSYKKFSEKLVKVKCSHEFNRGLFSKMSFLLYFFLEASEFTRCRPTGGI